MHTPRTFFASALLSVALTTAFSAQAQNIDANSVVQHYAQVVYANYSDVLTSAQALDKAIHAFTAAPSAQGLADAQKAWLAAREYYGQTEAFRFYSGPIDDDKGPEGRINAWPLDESYIDSVAGKPRAGIINNPKVKISKANLSRLNERGGEENIAAGWHAIEFMLWGQDQSDTLPGQRSFDDYVDGKTPHADRRRAFLNTASELLLDDLAFLVKSWEPGRKNYRAKFEQGGIQSVRKMVIGLGSLSRGELAGERMEVAMNTQDKEDEHSCFSDNTHRDIVTNAQGIENVWLGSYKRLDGSLLTGPSLKDLVASKNAALSQRTSQQIATSVAHASAIQAPFDREIVGDKSAPGRQRVQKTIDSLVQQSKDITEAAAALGITKLAQAK
nr:imelysin family protein [uncultured Rhodoferax sp.]